MLKFFAEKNVSNFYSAKATHIFSAKNIRILYIESAKTVNEMTLKELVKQNNALNNWALILWVLIRSTLQISFCGGIRKISIFFGGKKALSGAVP